MTAPERNVEMKVMEVVSIEKIEERLFSILVSDGVESCRSLCRVEPHGVSGSDVPITGLHFDDELSRLIARGRVDFKQVRQAIASLRTVDE